jgi:branched-chain amino acid transport system ATP-binding protein
LLAEVAVVAEPVLAVQDLQKAFGAVTASRNLSLEVLAGEIHALIGPNGAGKTSALAQLTGELAPDAGRILFRGEDITGLPVHERVRRGLARSFQVISLFDEFSAEDNAALAVQAHAGHSFRFWRGARGDERLRVPARGLLERVGLAAQADTMVRELSHGQRRRLEVAMALAGSPRLLLLDEPMAGLGAEGTEAMSQLLDGLKGSVSILLVEHDMDVVFRLADRITVLVGGAVVASDVPAAIRADPRVRAAYLGDAP